MKITQETFSRDIETLVSILNAAHVSRDVIVTTNEKILKQIDNYFKAEE